MHAEIRTKFLSMLLLLFELSNSLYFSYETMLHQAVQQVPEEAEAEPEFLGKMSLQVLLFQQLAEQR